jgi:tyrosyl-tRNA synthetase
MPLSNSAYIGFDPTAESIHLGNLVGYLALFRFRAAGYSPVVLFGGATGLIGDPSGRSSERSMLSMDEVHHNVSRFEHQFRRLDDSITESFFHTHEPTLLKPINYVNNINFYNDMNSLCFLRDIGKHFRVNQMLTRDSVKSRM